MSADASASDSSSSRLTSALVPAGNENANGTAPLPANSDYRLRLNPNPDHVPENYEDLQSEFPPLLLSSLESYLPVDLLNAPRETKYEYMLQILRRYSTKEERERVKWHSEYRQGIISSYQPLHRELYQLNAATFFVPSFVNACMANDDNRNESIRNIMSEPFPGIYTFEMLQPHFCEMMLDELENFEKWINETESSVMLPSTMNKYGVVLDDFGMESMLQKLMEDFIRPIAKIFFADVGGFALDSHHGYVVEYGVDRDVEMGFHVDDSEVTLNVCLGEKFTGGELFFRGVRCEKHQNTESLPEEKFEYSHAPGHAVIHRGHMVLELLHLGIELIYLFGAEVLCLEMRKHMKGYARWCVECQREKSERLHQDVAAKKREMLAVRLD